ncbi:acyl transferase/acyl hydrolase/lysophospholipase [Zopfochytrium polystomum]|nr:acyl transferase/acyl hydrolase/lysophospholipase [Zopfochytrium polystomum]
MIVEEEILFRRDRLRYCRASFAKYIGVPVEAVHEDDIPIIGVSGSGGGFKAMICTTGYLVAMEKEGLYDCVMYLSAVSGSCWTLSNLYRSAVATSPAKLAAYFIKTLPNHPADPSHLQANLAKSPLGRVTPLFGGLVDKRLAFLPRGVVDTYAVLMTAHFFSGEDREDFDPSDFKWSAQRRFMQGGRAPMPILTCIRHERPWYARVDRYAPEEYRRQQMLYEDNDETDMDKKQAEVQRNEAWWQWFELTPIQFGSDEQKIWIPTWSFGRKFEAGKSSNRCPEQSLSLQVGMVGSAMTAPFQTSLETLERSDPKSSMGKRLKGYAVKLLASGTSSLNVKSLLANHPFHSAYNWNPMYRILPSPQPPGLVNSPRIQLVDAGADNNQALYPFTRPGRKVDIMIVLDSSDDVERNIVTPDIEKFGKRKGFTFTRSTPTPPNFPPNDKTTPLSILYKNRYCQIFDGKANPPDKRVGEHGEPLAEADTTLIYIPTLTCDAQTPAFCPSDFSFAKLSYTLQECVGLLSCAEMNWMREKELIRATIKKCWERKRDARRRGC